MLTRKTYRHRRDFRVTALNCISELLSPRHFFKWQMQSNHRYRTAFRLIASNWAGQFPGRQNLLSTQSRLAAAPALLSQGTQASEEKRRRL